MTTLKQKIERQIEVWEYVNIDKLDILKWVLGELEKCETWKDVK